MGEGLILGETDKDAESQRFATVENTGVGSRDLTIQDVRGVKGVNYLGFDVVFCVDGYGTIIKQRVFFNYSAQKLIPGKDWDFVLTLLGVEEMPSILRDKMFIGREFDAKVTAKLDPKTGELIKNKHGETILEVDTICPKQTTEAEPQPQPIKKKTQVPSVK